MGIPIETRIANRGVVLFETVFLLTLLVILTAAAHVGIVRFWNGQLRDLEGRRLNYDGERRWKP